MKLAESVRTNKFKTEYSPGKKENVMKRLNQSKSKSPKGFGIGGSFMNDFAERETAKTLNQDLGNEVPAWYKTLKRQIG